MLSILVIAVTATSAGAAGWLPSVDLSDQFGVNDHQQLAVNASGETQVVWLRAFGSVDRVQSRRVGADGTLGPIRTLDTNNSFDPAVAIDAAGRAVVVWSRNDDHVYWIALDGTGDPVGSAADLTMASVDRPNVVMDEDGNATIAYPDGNDLNYVRIPQGGSPDAEATLFPGAGGENYVDFGRPPVQLAVDPTGAIIAGWVDYVSAAVDDDTMVRTRHIDADGDVETDPAKTLDSFEPFPQSGMQLGVDSSGDAVALWTNCDGSDTVWQARQVSAANSLGTIQNVSTPGNTVETRATITVQPDGSAAIGWEEDAMMTGIDTYVRRLAADNTLGSPQMLVAGDVSDLSSAPMSGGGTVFAWTQSDGGDDRVNARRLDSSDILSPIDGGLSAAGSNAEFAVAGGNPSADPSIVWDFFDPGGGTIVQLTSFDATPPVISTVAGPPSATTGQQLVFGASATDRSGISSYDWDFGDGGNASGAIVQHAYSAAGTFDVTVTVTDNAGNQSMSQLQVMVSAPSGGGGGTGGGTSSGGALSTFTVGGVAGKDLLVNLPAAGTVNISDAGAQGASSAALAAKSKRKLRPSSARGGPGTVRVRLRLTKGAKRKLKQRGRLVLGIVVAVTPDGGATTSQVTRVRLRRG